MKKYFVRLIDKNGMFISDDFVEELTEFTIETPCPSGFYHPRWNGEEWVEGLADEEIEEIKNSVVVEPNENEMLRDYVLELDMRMIMLEFGL